MDVVMSSKAELLELLEHAVCEAEHWYKNSTGGKSLAEIDAEIRKAKTLLTADAQGMLKIVQ